VNHFGLKFHHFGLAVRQPDSAFCYLRSLGYRDGLQVFDPLQRVNVTMRYHSEMPNVEVIWPGDGPSPIDNLLKRSNNLIYHLCYSTDDPQGALAAMAEVGLEVLPLSGPTPAILFGGREVSFYGVNNFGLIELIHGEPGEPAEAPTSSQTAMAAGKP